MAAPARKPRTRTTSPDPSPAGDADPDRVALVEIDGVTYTAPRRPPANLLVKYMWLTKQFGLDHALIQLLEDLAGPQVLLALMGEEDLTYEDLAKVLATVRELMTGRVEVAAGN